MRRIIEINKKKIQANAQKVIKHYEKNYNILTKKTNHKVYLCIINPLIENRDIEIYFTKKEMIFFFSFQHAHFQNNDVKGLIEYINDFLSNKIASIEYFEGDFNFFGGSREYDLIDLSSAETIVLLFDSVKDLLLYFRNNLWQVYVHCWNPSKDKAVAIIWDGFNYSVNKISNKEKDEVVIF